MCRRIGIQLKQISLQQEMYHKLYDDNVCVCQETEASKIEMLTLKFIILFIEKYYIKMQFVLKSSKISS